MDNKECSYTLFKQNIEKKILFMAMFIVGASLTVIPLTMVPNQVDAAPQLIPQLTDCKTIDGKSNAECKQVQDRNDDGYDNCKTSSTANNCKINQKVAVSNNFVNSETEAKIYQEVNSLVDCDYSASYCLARTFNDATQNVDVKTYKESTTGVKGAIDFDIDQKATQKIATDGQDRFVSKNTLNQNFLATAIPGTLATSSNTATIDADGSDAHIDMYATQFNDECDDSTCTNIGTQTYDLQANGRSSIDVSSNQGLQLYQTNNGCDDSDSGTVDINCINDASQVVKLVAGNLGTNNDASIKFDTLDNMVVDQYNNCDFGEYDCQNKATTLVDAFARGSSTMEFDDIEQDVTQSNNCDDLNNAITGTTYGCQNLGSVILEADSATDGVINVLDGEQTLKQQNICDTADCLNEATLYVGLGSDLPANSNSEDDPVDGTLTVDYNQYVDQTNRCEGDTACENEAFVQFLAYANDDATVTATSDQTVTQVNECGQNYDQICLNSALMVNDVFGSGTSEIYSTVDQDLYQYCGSNDGQTCVNSNTMFVDASATGGSDLDYYAIQNIQNSGDTNDGTAGITYITDTNSQTPYPSSLTSQYKQTTNTQVTNPQSNYP